MFTEKKTTKERLLPFYNILKMLGAITEGKLTEEFGSPVQEFVWKTVAL